MKKIIFSFSALGRRSMVETENPVGRPRPAFSFDAFSKPSFQKVKKHFFLKIWNCLLKIWTDKVEDNG